MSALKKFQPKSITSQPQNMKFWQLCSMSCLVFSVGGLWYKTILSREQVLTPVVIWCRVAMFGLVASVWEYHPDDSTMAKSLSIAVYWTLMVCWAYMMFFGSVVYVWLGSVYGYLWCWDWLCRGLSVSFCIGLKEARDIPQSESGNWTKTPSHDSKWFGLLR